MSLTTRAPTRMLCLTDLCSAFIFLSSPQVTGAQGFAQWNFCSDWPECEKHSKECLEWLRHPSHLCTLQSLLVQHSSSNNNFTEAQRAWKIKCLSHPPVFPAAGTELTTATFLQWSHQCVPLKSLGSLNGMKWHWISLGAPGDGHLELTELEGNWNGSIHWGVRGGTPPKKSVTPSSSMFLNTYLSIQIFAGTFLQAPYSPSLPQNQFSRVCFWFFILSGTLPSPQSPKGLQLLSRVLCTTQAFTRENKSIKWKVCA